MREAIRQVRRFEREVELFGTNKHTSPGIMILTNMLDQLLDETEVVSGAKSP
jgi:hypothetical protein